MPIPLLHEIIIPVEKWKAWFKGAKDVYLFDDRLREIRKRFRGSELAFDFSTYEGKAMAAKMIQGKLHVEECLVLCGFFYPIKSCDYTETHEGDATIESKLYSAVTGNETDEREFNRIGERVFNLERALLTREDLRGR